MSVEQLERDVAQLTSKLKKAEKRIDSIEKKQKEYDVLADKFKKNARLFFQRLRSQLSFKF